MQLRIHVTQFDHASTSKSSPIASHSPTTAPDVAESCIGSRLSTSRTGSHFQHLALAADFPRQQSLCPGNLRLLVMWNTNLRPRPRPRPRLLQQHQVLQQTASNAHGCLNSIQRTWVPSIQRTWMPAAKANVAKNGRESSVIHAYMCQRLSASSAPSSPIPSPPSTSESQHTAPQNEITDLAQPIVTDENLSRPRML